MYNVANKMVFMVRPNLFILPKSPTSEWGIPGNDKPCHLLMFGGTIFSD